MKNQLLFITGLWLALAGCGGPPEKGKKDDFKLPPQLVKAMTVQTETYVPLIHAMGQALPLREVTLSVEQPGKLQFLPAEVGETVFEKRPLARVRSLGLWSRKNQAAAQVQEIQTALTQAESDYKKVKELFDRGAVTNRDLETAELLFKTRKTQLTAANAGMSQLDETLYGTGMYAPFTGEISAKFQEVGNYVNMGTPLYRIVDLTTVRIIVGISELDIKFISQNDIVWITPLAYPDRGIRGTIHSVSPAQDPQLGAFPVEIRFPNVLKVPLPEVKNGDNGHAPVQRKWWILSGMTLRVKISRKPVTGLFVPAEALVERLGKMWVFTVPPTADQETAGTAEMKEVTLGRTYEGWYEVTSGLAPGARVIIAGNTKLRDRADVRVQLLDTGINKELVDAQTAASPEPVPSGTPAPVPAPAPAPAVTPSPAARPSPGKEPTP
jgi:RND family efflux transporter MFP subunit